MAGKKPKSDDSKLHAAAKVLGKQGGLVGGPSRAKKLTAQERSEIARLGGLSHDAKAGVKGKARMTEKGKSRKKGGSK